MHEGANRGVMMGEISLNAGSRERMWSIVARVSATAASADAST